MVNPKQINGDKKPALGLLPLAGQVHQALAHMDGAYKYGVDNWHENAIETMTYVHAGIRHFELYKNGENHARDTQVHNLGAVMACCAILLDAELVGKMNDDRTHNKAACDLLHAAESMVEKLKAMQQEREDNKDKKVYIATRGHAKKYTDYKPGEVVAACDHAAGGIRWSNGQYRCDPCFRADKFNAAQAAALAAIRSERLAERVKFFVDDVGGGV